MLKSKLALFALPLLLLFGNSSENSVAGSKQNSPETQTGTLQKMIVADGSVAMDVDLNRLNGVNSATGKLGTLRFTVAPNSFFTILVFNNVLRGPEFESAMALIPQSSATLPAALSGSVNQLEVEKLPSGAAFDLAVRDGKTGFVFFNVEGNIYDYDANAQLLSIKGGRLLISKEFAGKLGRYSEAGSVVGKISVGAAMQPIEIKQIVNGQPQSAVLPPVQGAPTARVPGPDVIVGLLSGLQQFGSDGTQVGLAVGTDSCNNGDQPLDWFSLPDNDHPVIPQNLYRMSGGANNDERFEQVGHSWLKHAFLALEDDACSFGCNTNNCTQGSHLCVGCSDPYGASLNASQNGLGSRAWVNPFTGFFPRGDSQTPPNNHTGHVHTGTSHRILVEASDLNTTLNPGATYYAEAAYISPHEYAWCQTHPGQCNMYNNASYQQYHVSGTTNFTFTPIGGTVRMQPAILAWTGQIPPGRIEPDQGNDGFGLLGYKVTNPSAGVWHYEYAVYNQNLDRAIQSFSVPLGPGISLSNIGFHAPPQHPAFANDGTVGSAGFSSTPWTPDQTANSLTWSTETFAQNPNANAIRWGTLYNFRFDSDQPPQTTNATIGFFKTGSPITVQVQAPTPQGTPSPTPTPTPSPTPTPTPTATPSPTPTPGVITLTASGRRVQGRHTVDLTWSGSNAPNIDIYRDGVVIATVPNNGTYKDFIGVRGGNARYTYKVCDAGTQNCSNEVTVRFGGPPL
jgi:hypothetical protein